MRPIYAVMMGDQKFGLVHISSGTGMYVFDMKKTAHKHRRELQKQYPKCKFCVAKFVAG